MNRDILFNILFLFFNDLNANIIGNLADALENLIPFFEG
jgi:hypothetical protein